MSEVAVLLALQANITQMRQVIKQAMSILTHCKKNSIGKNIMVICF